MSPSDKAPVESTLSFLKAHIALTGLLDAYEQKHELPSEKQINVPIKILRKQHADAAAFLIQLGHYAPENAKSIVAELCDTWERLIVTPWGYPDLAAIRGAIQRLVESFSISFRLLKVQELETPTNPSRTVGENESSDNGDNNERSERPAIYWVGDRTYRVGQSEPIPVSEPHDCILRAFLKHPVLDLPGLVRHSGLDRESILTTLKRLCNGYRGAFKSTITRPGKRGPGYRANVVDARPTKDEQLAI